MALKGREWFKARVQTFIANFPNTVQKALYQEGMTIALASLQQCPVEYGRLRSSFMLAPLWDGSIPKVLLSYGVEYAVYVHERIGLTHNPPTKAKYLEDPYNAALPALMENVWRRTSAMLKASGGTGDTDRMEQVLRGTEDGTLA